MPMAVRLRARDGVSLEAHPLDVADDRFDLFGPGAGLHDDEHCGSPGSIIERSEASFRRSA